MLVVELEEGREEEEVEEVIKDSETYKVLYCEFTLRFFSAPSTTVHNRSRHGIILQWRPPRIKRDARISDFVCTRKHDQWSWLAFSNSSRDLDLRACNVELIPSMDRKMLRP